MFLTQSMPRRRRDTAAAVNEDTVQVENERPCTLYTHQVEDIVTRFLVKTNAGTRSQVEKVVEFADMSAAAGWSWHRFRT